MTKLYAVLFFVCLGFTAAAQQYGNEWINYSQKYYTIKVVQNGIYRIDSTTLANAGIDLTTVDPRNFQLFGRQKQQAIFVNGENDGVFNNGDYIEFIGFKNDGWLDSLLYNNVNEMPDLYYSLYNDTARYYLTYNTSLTNLRAKNLTDTTFSSYTPEPYYMVNAFVKHADEYYVGPQLEGASQSRFVNGEGWHSVRFQGIPGGTTFSDNVSTPFPYVGAGAPQAIIKARAASASNAASFTAGSPNHHLRIEYGSLSTPIIDTAFLGYYPVRKNHYIPSSDLGTSTTNVTYRIIDDLDVDSDIFNVASTSIEYPRIPNFGGASTGEFKVSYNTLQPYTRYSIANYSGSSPLMYMVGDSVWRTTGRLTGSTLDVLVPNDVPSSTVHCYTYNTVNNVTLLAPINGTGLFTDYGALTIDSAYIIITHRSLDTAAMNYAAYRSSPQGGSHNTVVVYTNELYDQFGGGVYKHVLGLRRFCDYAIHTWPTKPKYLFLIGKSIREANEGFGGGTVQGSRKNVVTYRENLVPSYGYPSSDNRITAGLDGTFLEPAIHTGRISVNSNAQVTAYLNKMVEYESAQQLNLYTKDEKDWMKHVLEFGGGSNNFEQIQFRNYLLAYKQTLEDSAFAGSVDTSFKTSSEPIDPVDFQEINDRIDNGVSIMLFFGHASIGGFDQNVDEVDNWQNQGRYPLLIGNACYTGDIHQPGALSVSEMFTLIPDKGVIGFLSTVKQGFVNELNLYSDQMTRQISRLTYGESIGENIKRTIQQVQTGIVMTDPINSIPSEEVFTGMTLHGDPALKVNSHQYPELVIENSDVFIEPNDITLADDSMDVNLIITNLGKGTYEPFIAKLTRTFPNGHGDSTYLQIVNGVRYKDTIAFRIPVYHSIAFGNNHFSISIDLENPAVTEMYDEVNNNQIAFDFSINANAIFPVYPYKFAIIPDSVVTHKASTVDPLSPVRAYRFELDTTDAFNSPFKRYLVVNSAGGVVEVSHNAWLSAATNTVMPLVHTDSTVYYWRCSPDSSVFLWQESSYQYIRNKEGWGQAHFFQFDENRYTHLGYNKPSRKWEFESLDEVVSVQVVGYPATAEESFANGWFLNGVNMEYDGTTPNSTFLPGLLYVAVIDPFDPDPWRTFDGSACGIVTASNVRNYGQFNLRHITGFGRCRGEEYFGFRQSQQAELDSLYDMIVNDIPCGHYYMIWSYITTNFAEWDAHNPNMYTMFQDLGVTGLTPGMTNRPLIVMGRKCDTASTKFILGDTVHTGAILKLTDTLSGILPGFMESVKIGPAYQWNTLYWKQHPLEAVTGDSTQLYVYGVRHDGVEVKLFDTLFTTLDSITNLNTLVDAATYPYIRLRALTVDNVTLTPAYFDRWQILYTPVPEAALSPADGLYFSINADSLAEGDEFKFAIAIKNISNSDMDSLLVHYWVEDQNRIKHYITYSRQDSLRVGETLYDTVTVPTVNVGGNNYLWVEANPVPLASTTGLYDQLEQYHFNNIARIPFLVTEDNENPILDVTFDGRHILNGDIVSAKPFVVISLDDENEFLLMNQPGDTSRFLLYLTPPNGVEQKLFFNAGGVPQLHFIPAGSDNKCKIEWNAQFNTDGVYTLRLRAWDKNDNRSGGKDYKIQFEVIQRQTITHVMNYPNPFSTKTHFVFTLTGTEVPHYMKIQIFNVSGKVVREITMDELGTLYIGKNITDYAWDGRDTYGDQLANGVYFYRVITKDSGLSDVEQRESGADQYFKKGFGKMYLMR